MDGIAGYSRTKCPNEPEDFDGDMDTDWLSRSREGQRQ
jgi:hypothetical protein